MVYTCGIGGFKYAVEVACLRVAFEYFENDYMSNLDVFQIFLRFIGSREIACDCMRLLLTMVEKTSDREIQGHMIQMMSDANETFEELSLAEDDDTVVLAEQCLDLITTSEV